MYGIHVGTLALQDFKVMSQKFLYTFEFETFLFLRTAEKPSEFQTSNRLFSTLVGESYEYAQPYFK